MKKLYLLFFSLIGLISHSQSPIITAIVDGDCSGGNPKLLEIYASGTVDFSLFSLENQTNANMTWGNTQDLSALGTVTNSFVYVTTSGSETAIGTDFPSITFTNPNVLVSNTMNVNGDDRVRIIFNSDSTVVDQFGAEGTDGTGEAWEYADSYAKRNDNTGPDGGFDELNWTFGGVGSFDTLGVCQGGSDTFETLMGGIGNYASTGGSCGVQLGSPTIVCSTNTAGDNNDGVTLNIPYNGVDAGITSVTSTTAVVGGDDPSTVSDGVITLTNLTEGDAWDLTLNGGDCDGTTISDTVDPAECDPAPNTCFDLSMGTELFELVTVQTNSDMDEWTENSGTYNMNGFCGGGCAEQVETWLIFGPLDMTGVSDLDLMFDAAESFGDTNLNINYTAAYTGCPSSTTWFTTQVITDPGFYAVDVSIAVGTEVYIGIEYNDDGADGYSNWSLSNVELAAFGSCPTLGTRTPSDCATCDVALQTETYDCTSNTAGDNNDAVTINIAYTGSDATITSVTTTSSGTVGGDDPATVSDGTISLTGLGEGDAWDITINGGDCDGTTISGTVPSDLCDPALPLPISEDFTYPDGSLISNGAWESHSGTEGDLLVASGQAVVQHGVPSEDANIEFIPVTGNIYYAFDFSISDPDIIGTNGTDFEYFAHLMNNGSDFSARLDVVAPSGAGDFTLGIATDNATADASWATDLDYGTTYRVTVRFDQDNFVSELWVDAASESDTSILGADLEMTQAANQFALRQSDSSENEAILVDNLVIAQTFAETLSNDEYYLDQLSLYPNPTGSGFVTITSSNNDQMDVQVFDILGKQVKSETLTNNTLNVSNLNSGIYLVKITQNNASTIKKLVIK